ncbi:MAG: sigma-70 family RNA polymerase sigma factor, partial [Verrucomicrobiota bacterium]
MQIDWEQLYDENARPLTLYARQWLPTLSDAEDCVQDAFIRLIKSPKQFSEKPIPILYQAVKWAALDRIRSSQRREKREESSVENTDHVAFFEDHLEQKERKEAIEHAMRQLPDEQREVLTMHIWVELAFREIGEALGISINTAASRYRYALKKLSQLL